MYLQVKAPTDVVENDIQMTDMPNLQWPGKEGRMKERVKSAQWRNKVREP